MLTSKLRSKLKAIMSKEPAICHIGKDGITQNVLQSINNALIARECVKISVLNNCDDDLRNIANKIEIALSCETVDILGRKILLYKFNKDNKKPYYLGKGIGHIFFWEKLKTNYFVY